MLSRRLLAAVLSAGALISFPSYSTAQGLELNLKLPHRFATPDRPAAEAREEVIGGELEALVVHDNRHGASMRYFALREANGTRTPIRWLDAEVSVPGSTVQLHGRRGGTTFFVDAARTVLPPNATFRDGPPEHALRYTGKLEVLHVDDPENDRCELHYVLKNAEGAHLRLDMAVVPDLLEEGMDLSVDGVATGDGLAVVPSAITIEPTDPMTTADAAADAAADVSGTTKVLVILVKFANTTSEPYTRDQLTSTVFTGSNSVAKYYRETSYGKHSIAGSVTPWLRAGFNRPTTCDYTRVSQAAMTLARSAGYDTTAYHKFVFVFPSLPCGWSGLGGGAYAWINGSASTLVIGHELGHTFGLGHASHLRCTNGGAPSPLDGSCTRSEYGDYYSMMGNNRAAHFSAPHKVELGYIGSTGHRVHKGGSVTYTLSPYETTGGTTYAVKIPASAKRTYWLEYRQPIGFDATFPDANTTGALVHTAYPSELGCDSCVLDMNPTTSTFGDAALQVGQTYNDPDTKTTISVLSRTSSQLSVRVTTPTRPTYRDVPTTHPAYQAIETLAWYGIPVACATGSYCPDRPITRAEMAAFLERAKRGASYNFTATGTRFSDMSLSHWAVEYAEQLYRDGITVGCATSPLRYCPESYITRAQMAPMLLKARYGSTFNPGTASGTLFYDVPRTHSMAAWIERLYSYQVTLGCSSNPRYYCPGSSVTRAQMALFIQRAFGLMSPPL